MGDGFRDIEDILAMFRHLQMERAPLIEQMEEIRRTVNDEQRVHLPELDANEKSFTPNLLEQGLDQMANRIVSTQPDVTYPPVVPDQKTSMAKARKRRLANLGWWEQNHMPRLDHRRARQLLAYASAPVMIRPSKDLRGPMWQVHDPRMTYPVATPNPFDPRPPQCVFAQTHTWAWLTATFPEAASRVEHPADVRSSDTFEVLEYVDANEITLMVVSNRESVAPSPVQRGYSDGRNRVVRGSSGSRARWEGNERIVPLERLVNKAGQCLAIIPERPTLDKPKGQYDGMVGMYLRQSMLFALEYIAVENDVLPDEWLEANDPMSEARILTMANGRKGVIGKTIGGKVVTHSHQPGYMTAPTIERLAQYQRQAGGIPLEFGGESPSNTRTGRRGDAVLSAAIDYTIQTAQTMLQESKQEENRAAIGVDKGWFGKESKSFYVSFGGTNDHVDYVPDDIFDSDRNTVRYPFAGVDLANLTVAMGQRIGEEEMSLRTAMEHDPMIPDVELELRRLGIEKMRRALGAAVEQDIANEKYGAPEVAQMVIALGEGKTMEEAVMAIHQQAQEAQATSGAPGTPTGPAEPGSPEAQAGLSGDALAQATASVGPVGTGEQNFAAQLGNLFPAQRQIQRNRATAAAQ